MRWVVVVALAVMLIGSLALTGDSGVLCSLQENDDLVLAEDGSVLWPVDGDEVVPSSYYLGCRYWGRCGPDGTWSLYWCCWLYCARYWLSICIQWEVYCDAFCWPWWGEPMQLPDLGM